MAYSTTLTPSATTGSITLTLGSGNWNTDARIVIGCRVVGNGGVASLTAAPAAQTTITASVDTAFTNTNAISSGSWYLYCTKFNGGVSVFNTYQFQQQLHIHTQGVNNLLLSRQETLVLFLKRGEPKEHRVVKVDILQEH